MSFGFFQNITWLEKKDCWNFKLIRFVKPVFLLLMDLKLTLKSCPPSELITTYPQWAGGGFNSQHF